MFGHVVGEARRSRAAHPFRHETSHLVFPRLAFARLRFPLTVRRRRARPRRWLGRDPFPNHGVWDQQYLDPENPNKREPGKGRIRISIEDYEKNLRAIVARLKQTKATLIWASTTPILVGTPPGYVGGEMVDKYNEVAAKIMQENGVIIEISTPNAAAWASPRRLNVHDVGDLAL